MIYLPLCANIVLAEVFTEQIMWVSKTKKSYMTQIWKNKNDWLDIYNISQL